MAEEATKTETPSEPATPSIVEAIADGGSPKAAADLIEHETPASELGAVSEELQSDLTSRYGDILPDVIEELLPAGKVPAAVEGGEKTDPQPEGGTAPSTDGGEVIPEPVTKITQPEEGGQPDELAQARAVITQLTSLVQGQQPVGEQSTAEVPAGEQLVNPLEVVPDYDFDIPDQLVTMLASEDAGERKQAMGALTKGIAQTIHQETMGTVAKVIATLQTEMPQAMMQQVEQKQQQAQIGKDFYSKYPTLNNPALMPTVSSVAKTLMQQDLLLGIQPQWNEAFMDRVATGVQALFGKPATPTPTPETPPIVEPVAVFGGSTGGGALQATTLAKGVTTQQDHINDLFE